MLKVINDPCYPQIAIALDTGTMAQVLQSILFPTIGNPDEGIVIVSCEIKNKRHKPGKSFVLSYHLFLFDKQTHNRWEQIVGARLCRTGCGQKELVEERTKHTRNTGLQSPVIYQSDLEMMVWVFPHDRKLVHLEKILDVSFLKSHIDKMLPLLNCNGGYRINEIQTEVLHYLPERSCMVRYRLILEDTRQQERIEKIIYGKNYRDDRGDEVDSIMRQLVEQLPKCALPLGYDKQYRTLWQAHISGTPLEWQDLETSNAHGLLRAMAECLSVFQSCQVTTIGRYGFQEIDEQLFDTIKAAEPQDKMLTEQVKRQVASLITLRDELCWHETEMRPLHQDLHLGNFMVEQNTACLIDLDSVCLGDPLADIGSLVTNFYRNGLHAGRSLIFTDDIVDSFLAAYEESISWKIDHSHLNWFIAAAFVHEVIRRILRQRHELGLAHIKTYLELSERYAELAAEVSISA
jgi:hypothetical protein